MPLIICDPGHVPTGLNPDGTPKPCAAEGTPEAEEFHQLVAEAQANVIPEADPIAAPEAITVEPVAPVQLAETGGVDMLNVALLGIAVLCAAGIALIRSWERGRG